MPRLLVVPAGFVTTVTRYTRCWFFTLRLPLLVLHTVIDVVLRIRVGYTHYVTFTLRLLPTTRLHCNFTVGLRLHTVTVVDCDYAAPHHRTHRLIPICYTHTLPVVVVVWFVGLFGYISVGLFTVGFTVTVRCGFGSGYAAFGLRCPHLFVVRYGDDLPTLHTLLHLRWIYYGLYVVRYIYICCWIVGLLIFTFVVALLILLNCCCWLFVGCWIYVPTFTFVTFTHLLHCS